MEPRQLARLGIGQQQSGISRAFVRRQGQIAVARQTLE
jgi:hypothetical protein